MFERLPQDIINGQTLNVDVISGATVTSEGIVQGIADAIEQEKIQIFYGRVLNQSFSGLMRFVEETTDVVVIGTGGAGLSAAATVMKEKKSSCLRNLQL